MGTDYKLRLKSAAGVLVAEITDFLEVIYVKRVNSPGICGFTLSSEHAAIDLLEHRSQIEVWRRNKLQGIDWYADFYGLFLDQEFEYSRQDLFRARCPGQMWLLDTRHVLWPAGTSDRSQFSSTAAETVLKTLVDYNAAANATTGNGRIRTGTITGLSIEVDGAGGNSIDWFCAWKRLLPELQEIAQVAGGDFDLVKTGAQTWEFRWYAGQLGTDRTSTVQFSLAHGNMANPRYRYDRRDERTVAAVAGQGQGANRAVAVRTGTDYAASNDIETFKDARNRSTLSGLNSVGDAWLSEKQAREHLSFDVLQTPASLYGKHYFLGDLVTARYRSDFIQKVDGMEIEFSNGGIEIITIETRTQ